MKSRPYRMTERARSSERTAERILESSLARFGREPYEEVTLATIAEDAGVTTRTVLRRFGSKEKLVDALVELTAAKVVSERAAAPPGDVGGTVAVLVAHYEQYGDLMLHVLRQEQQVPAFARAASIGRSVHRDWIDVVFSPWIADLRGALRVRRRAQLSSVCDLFMWHLLRQREGLSVVQTRRAIEELIEGVLP